VICLGSKARSRDDWRGHAHDKTRMSPLNNKTAAPDMIYALE